MSERVHAPLKPPPAPALSLKPAPVGTLQRKCACGGSGSSGGECEECKKKEMTLQRRASDNSAPTTVPPIVYDVLRSPGQPLDVQTRAFFEPRFGHDFSKVRIHTDARAAESARAVNALAYTAGRDVVFAPGLYSVSTSHGRRLLAHELAHVVQQRNCAGGSPRRVSRSDDPSEREASRAVSVSFDSKADASASRIASSHPQNVLPNSVPVQIMRSPDNCGDVCESHFNECLKGSFTGVECIAQRGVCYRGCQGSSAPGASSRAAAPAATKGPTAGHVCFDGTTVTVSKDGKSGSCPAITSSSAPTPEGRFCVRKQGEAQLPWHWYRFWRPDRSSWFLLEPQFTTTRYRMDLHPGSISEGCVTVTDHDCFNDLAKVLNTGGTTTGFGYDGYPPGNAEHVHNPKKTVECVAMLEVSHKKGTCGTVPRFPKHPQPPIFIRHYH